MDIKRSFIITGLAVVAYLLVLAWNEDYGQTSPSVDREQTSSSIPSLSEDRYQAPVDTNTDTDNSSQETNEFNIPEQEASDTSVEIQEPTLTTRNTIFIHTDVLELEIDLEGGNIVSATMANYDTSLGSNQALPLLENNRSRYYVVESGLFGKNGFDSSKNGPTPVYSSVSRRYELADGAQELVVTLDYQDDSGITLSKIYRLQRNDYLIDVGYQISNQTEQSWTANFSGKIVRDQSIDPSSQSSMGMQSFLGMVISSKEEPYEKIDFDDMLESPLNRQIQGGWIAFIQHYFLSAWIPNQESTHTYQSKVRNGKYLMGFVSPALTVEPKQTEEISAQLYLGPKLLERLEAAAPRLDLTVDYGWLFFIAYPLFLLLDFFYGLVQNWGVAIILVTVVVKALFFQLSAASYRSMANMRRVAPKLKSLKEQHGDDRQKMSQAMMDLYKKEKINPLGGCLPILVQMPVFIALYWVLLESVQLRHAPFFFWITDLSVKDPYFLLPILMGASMFIQMQLNPAPPDPMQARIMKIMPVMMTVFFLWFPSGLVLYWVVNNVLSIAQQWVITRQIERSSSTS